MRFPLRKILTLSAPAIEAIEARAEDGPGGRQSSAAACQIVERYAALMACGLAQAREALTPEDWGLLRAITNGSRYDHPDAVVVELLGDVRDAEDDFGDTTELRVRLSRLSPMAIYAVAEECERFWRERRRQPAPKRRPGRPRKAQP